MKIRCSPAPEWRDLPECDQRLCAKPLDRGNGRRVDGVRQRCHFLEDRMKRVACFVDARAFAAIFKCLSDLGRVLDSPGRPDPRIAVVFGVSLRQRGRPTPVCDIISIDQRLKSGAEFDQFGVEGLRGRGWRRQWQAGANGSAGGGHSSRLDEKPRREDLGVVADVFVGGVLSTRLAWAWKISPCSGLEPGRKLALPLGLLFRYT